jgi:outer membrane protein assembly factor BamB
MKLRFPAFRLPARVATVGAALLCLVTGPAESGDWPQFLGPTRNGLSAETVAPWTDAPTIAWRHKAGSGFGSPVAADGRVYLHTAVPDKDAEEIVAYDAVSGNEIWRTSYERAPYRSDLGVGPRATPAVADGRIYTIGITGVLSCHDAATGERQWQTNPYETLGASLPTFGACSSPVAVGDRLVVLVGGAGNGVVGYDAKTGELAWKGLDEPAGTASPIVRQLANGDAREVIVQTTLRLAGLDLQTGSLNWAHPLVFEPSGVAPTPLLAGDRLLCATQDTGVIMIDLPDAAGESPQQTWWNESTSTYFSTGAVSQDGHAFVVTNSLLPLPRADVTLFSGDSEQSAWTAEGLGYFHIGLIALADGRLLILDDAGNLILSRPGAEGLEEQSRAKVCNGTFASPALANGRLFVRDNTELLCVELPAAAPAAAN